MEVIIATLLSRTGPTGVQAHVREVSRYLMASAVAHSIVTPFDRARVLSYPMFALRKALEGVAAAPAIWLYRRGHALFLGLALRHRTRSGRPCVIYAQCPVSARAALASCRTPAQRVVLVVHFNESPADEWVGKGMLRKQSWLYNHIRAEDASTIRRVAGLVFVSRYMRDCLSLAIPGINEVPQAVVPNFIIRPPTPESKSSPFDLVSIGTLEARKNQGFLLDVLAAARRRGHRFSLALVGDGPDRPALEGKARALGLESEVSFLGKQSDGARFFDGAKACVHSALIENLPIVLIEALRAGIPVFAPATGGTPEVFDDGVEGNYWPIDDPERAAGMLCDVLADDAVRQRMGAAARQRFEDCFSESVAGARLVAFLSTRSI